MDLKDSRRLPAFPTGIDTDQAGMTLRDYFAAQALIGSMSMAWHPEMGVDWRSSDPERAEHAYRLADAMLKARAK